MHGQTRILQSILNSMADGVVVVEQSGKCILSNPAAERIAGFCSDGLPHDQWPVRYGLCKGDLKTPHPPEELPFARACQGETVKEQEVGIRHGRLPEGVVVSVDPHAPAQREGPHRRRRGRVVAIFHCAAWPKTKSASSKLCSKRLNPQDDVIWRPAVSAVGHPSQILGDIDK